MVPLDSKVSEMLPILGHRAIEKQDASRMENPLRIRVLLDLRDESSIIR